MYPCSVLHIIGHKSLKTKFPNVYSVSNVLFFTEVNQLWLCWHAQRQDKRKLTWLGLFFGPFFCVLEL